MSPQTVDPSAVIAGGGKLELLRKDCQEQESVREEAVNFDQEAREYDHWVSPRDVYSLEVRLCPEQVGGYSIYVPGLPGVVSEGETQEQALAGITEALQAAIEGYSREGRPVPWAGIEDQPESEPGEIKTWITVDA